MLPTIHPSDIVITINPSIRQFKRGDIAVFGYFFLEISVLIDKIRNPIKANEQVIKRIVAIEGDTIQPRDPWQSRFIFLVTNSHRCSSDS